MANRTFQRRVCYAAFSRTISIVDTFRVSPSSPKTSEAIRTSLMVSFPWKNRRLTTSTTSTAWLIDCPRALTVRVFWPLLKCIMTAVAYAINGFLPINTVSGGIWPRGLSCRGLSSRCSGADSALSGACSVLSGRGSCLSRAGLRSVFSLIVVLSVVIRLCSNNEHGARRCVLRVCYHRDGNKVIERREKKRVRGKGFLGEPCLEYLS